MKLTVAKPPKEMSDGAYWFAEALRIVRKLQRVRRFMRDMAVALEANGHHEAIRAQVVKRLRAEAATMDGRRKPKTRRSTRKAAKR